MYVVTNPNTVVPTVVSVGAAPPLSGQLPPSVSYLVASLHVTILPHFGFRSPISGQNSATQRHQRQATSGTLQAQKRLQSHVAAHVSSTLPLLVIHEVHRLTDFPSPRRKSQNGQFRGQSNGDEGRGREKAEALLRLSRNEENSRHLYNRERRGGVRTSDRGPQGLYASPRIQHIIEHSSVAIGHFVDFNYS